MVDGCHGKIEFENCSFLNANVCCLGIEEEGLQGEENKKKAQVSFTNCR